MSDSPPTEPRLAAFDLGSTQRERISLNGHTIEQLSDYLDRGREPAEASIDESPECAIALRSLEHLRRAQQELLRGELSREALRDDSWVTRILNNITLEAHAGRDVLLPHPLPTARLVVTEGALRGILRETGDQMTNVLVGRCALIGDIDIPGAPITIAVDITVFPKENIPRLVDRLRTALAAAVQKHTQLVVAAIDITVRDLHTHSTETALSEESR